MVKAAAQIVERFLARSTYAQVPIKEGKALAKGKGWLRIPFTPCSTLKEEARLVGVWLRQQYPPMCC